MFGVENTFGFILRWPGGISCKENNGETKSVKRIQSMKENGGVCYTNSEVKTAPPCGGSHPAPKWDD